MDLVTLADAPTLAPDQELPRAQIVVAKLGTFKDRRYGEFSITRRDVDSWKTNLAKLPGGEAPIDFDHGPETGKGSKAAAWITTLDVKTGRQLKAEDPRRFARLADDREYAAADVQFSKAGADSVRNREYRLISPTFSDHWRDEYGNDHGKTLVGGALTNRPALKRDMPVISLSEDFDPDSLAREVSDSRGHMTPLANIAKVLRLDEDADEAKILAHLGDVVILSTADHTDLQSRAAQGDEAVRTLHEDRFTAAWDTALGKHVVAPAEKDGLKELYDAKPDTVIALIDARVAAGIAVAPGAPKGDGGDSKTLNDTTDPEDRQAILARARTLMAADKTLTLSDALDRVEDELAAQRQED